MHVDDIGTYGGRCPTKRTTAQ